MKGNGSSRRHFLRRAGLVAGAALTAPGVRVRAEGPPPRILLRSSWQTVNIGDIAHTPGMLTLLEAHLPEVEVTLWPNRLSEPVEAMLRTRFPKLRIARTPDEQRAAVADCGFALHGSGPGLVGAAQMELWRKTGKPYGFGGVTLSDDEIRSRRDLMAGARFVFCRDTDSLAALRASGLRGPDLDFTPDATFDLDLHNDPKAEAFLR
jgi:hypothetical protein